MRRLAGDRDSWFESHLQDRSYPLRSTGTKRWVNRRQRNCPVDIVTIVVASIFFFMAGRWSALYGTTKPIGLTRPANSSEAVKMIERCACGDVYDSQLQLCFMMDPGIVLWFAGHGPTRPGKFISDLAFRLKGIVSPHATYQNANCRLGTQGALKTFARYSYSLTEAEYVQQIYATCKILPSNFSRCISKEREFRGVRHDAYDGRETRSELLCADETWCITSKTPARIGESIDAMRASCRSKRGAESGKESRLKIVEFSKWATLGVPVAAGHVKSTIIGSGLGGEVHYGEVGGWEETMERFRALWRCGIHFAMARYGDGELAVLRGHSYQSEKSEGGMYLGLPFHFCAQGMLAFSQGGGGHYDWLVEYLNRYAGVLQSVDPHRMVYSWQWGHLNYPAAIEFIREIGETGNLILICNEKVAARRSTLPVWATTILTVPGDGLLWLQANLHQISEEATRIASALQDVVFVFSAGPLSNVLIPIMWKANPGNTYLDFGGTLDFELYGVRTRPFHPDVDRVKSTKPWNKADGSLEINQTCLQTRWSVYYEPRVVSSDG
jgi:hypothetical protein